MCITHRTSKALSLGSPWALTVQTGDADWYLVGPGGCYSLQERGLQGWLVISYQNVQSVPAGKAAGGDVIAGPWSGVCVWP